VGEIEHVDHMHVGVDQTGQGKLAATVDPDRILRHMDRFTRPGHGDDSLTVSDNGPLREQLARLRIKHSAAFDHDRRFSSRQGHGHVQPQADRDNGVPGFTCQSFQPCGDG
jgi:hypothetical protein